MSHALRYHPSEDQLSLVSTLSDAFDTLLPISRLHTSHEESADTWAELESLGLFSIGLAEEEGGSGLGAIEEALIVGELGQRLVAPAVLATIGAVHSGSSRALALEIGQQGAAFAYRNGQRIVMVDDRHVRFVLMRDGSQTALYEKSFAAGLLDDRLWLASLGEVESLPQPVARFEDEGLLRLRLNDAAALSGIAHTAVGMAVRYAEERRQFGRPIGSFQAIKHHCANMAIAARRARDQVSFAAVALEDQRDDAELQVNCALLVAATAALDNSGKNIQVHGGMGFSAEADPHLLLKRAQLLIAVSGGLETANANVAGATAGDRG